MSNPNSQIAQREKNNAALSSVIAALGLTSFKIIVGVATGSLGILAEAAHSGLDLVAALVTFLAVRLSVIPADSSHLYGHGKVENISALFETLLLLITCAWIIYEATQRLFFKTVVIEVNVWAFVVMITSIVIDYFRSRVLYKTARKYNSQALEADALHFSTDIWSSSVVIFGLICVKVGEWNPPWAFLYKSDSLAALGVALIVIYVSIELGIRTIQALLDVAPPGKVEEITSIVEAVSGVINCHNVRVRYSGPHLYIDTHILIDGNQSVEQGHAITEMVEEAIRKNSPEADITVHFEPAPVGEEIPHATLN
jgi:cation diffusion facilitator family transporter